MPNFNDYSFGWLPTKKQVAISARLIPLVLAINDKDYSLQLTKGINIKSVIPNLSPHMTYILEQAGWIDSFNLVTPLGERGLQKGPGVFGIELSYYSSYCKELYNNLSEENG